MKANTALPACLAITLFVSGCTVTPPAPTGNPELIAFLADGRTTKTDTLLRLGQPTGRFESDQILTYRLGYDAKRKGYYVVVREGTPDGWPTWSWTKFSLVLVYDDTGVLTKHSLVRVNQ